MFEIKGKYNSAKIFTDYAEETAVAQITELLNQSFTQNSTIRIMPDVHAGKGCTIGTTMTITDKIVPNLVGVDIACALETVELFNWQPSTDKLKQLDDAIKRRVPAGFNVHDKSVVNPKLLGLEKLRCYKHLSNINRINCSVGTLGGGNHFIELNKSKDDKFYLVVHSGSRNLGKQVCEYYQNFAITLSQQITVLDKLKIRNELIAAGKQNEIEKTLRQMKTNKIQKHLAYLYGPTFDDYIHDMRLVTRYANLNRVAIIEAILEELEIDSFDRFTTLHNYIDTDNMILRKGAVSAQEGERLLIPLNMRDGSLLCVGKGNPDWNYSAPHGAGRIMSRGRAKGEIKIEDFKKSMDGIYTTSVAQSTIDESPFAYKPFEEIIANIGDTVDIVDRIVPIYNFKAGGD